MSLKVVIPKGRVSYYLRGTVTVGRKSQSVYETTGIRVGQVGAKAFRAGWSESDVEKVRQGMRKAGLPE